MLWELGQTRLLWCSLGSMSYARGSVSALIHLNIHTTVRHFVPQRRAELVADQGYSHRHLHLKSLGGAAEEALSAGAGAGAEAEEALEAVDLVRCTKRSKGAVVIQREASKYFCIEKQSGVSSQISQPKCGLRCIEGTVLYQMISHLPNI